MTFVLESQSESRDFRTFVSEEVHEELSSEFVMNKIEAMLERLRSSTNLNQDFENFANNVQKLVDELAERARLLVAEMGKARISSFTTEQAVLHQDELMPLISEALQQLVRNTPDLEVRQVVASACNVLYFTRVSSPASTTPLRLAMELRNRVPLH